MPSEKYSSWGFPLVLAKGRTASVLIGLRAAAPSLALDRCNAAAIWPRNANAAAASKRTATPMRASLRFIAAGAGADSSSVLTSSCADCGRSAGSLAIARVMSEASGAGMFRFSSSIGRGFSEICAAIICCAVFLAANGCVPASNSYAITPHA